MGLFLAKFGILAEFGIRVLSTLSQIHEVSLEKTNYYHMSLRKKIPVTD